MDQISLESVTKMLYEEDQDLTRVYRGKAVPIAIWQLDAWHGGGDLSLRTFSCGRLCLGFRSSFLAFRHFCGSALEIQGSAFGELAKRFQVREEVS